MWFHEWKCVGRKWISKFDWNICIKKQLTNCHWLLMIHKSKLYSPIEMYLMLIRVLKCLFRFQVHLKWTWPIWIVIEKRIECRTECVHISNGLVDRVKFFFSAENIQHIVRMQKVNLERSNWFLFIRIPRIVKKIKRW